MTVTRRFHSFLLNESRLGLPQPPTESLATAMLRRRHTAMLLPLLLSLFGFRVVGPPDPATCDSVQSLSSREVHPPFQRCPDNHFRFVFPVARSSMCSFRVPRLLFSYPAAIRNSGTSSRIQPTNNYVRHLRNTPAASCQYRATHTEYAARPVAASPQE